ncbi:Endonuclease/exonuclease/phosphatase [Trametes meyenii]|nr:Endonuclease/exonuclease/phosphatase [Trametes meyenii]
MAGAYQPTPEDLAKAEQRRIKKEQTKNNPLPVPQQMDNERGRILPREWVDVNPTGASIPGQTVRVMTWNVLAQTLVRRELFPTSDCLKASQREHMLYREIASHKADICCLQEVDRTEKLFPELRKAGYAWVYAVGPRKKHGCLIAFRKDAYECVRQRVVAYDDQDVREDGSAPQARRGSSFRTKNIGSLVALRKLGAGSEGDGVIVATTHLFWHPAQAAILLREVIKFRAEGPDAQRRWPSIIAGDFNFGPDDPAYALLMGDPLLPNQQKRLDASYVVHATIDPTASAPGGSAAPAEEDEQGETDPDRIIVNARPAQPSDGLLSQGELQALFARSGAVTSAYDDGLRRVPGFSESGLAFGSRVSVPSDRRGGFESVYTSYTHYWQAVLDYIFVLDAPGRDVSILRLAKPHSKEAFGEGLPRKGVCGSDHISLAAELHWPAS